MENSEISGLGRLREDPKAAAIIAEFEGAASNHARLGACLRLAEHLMVSGRNDQAHQALEIAREFAKDEEQQAAWLRYRAEMSYRQCRYAEALESLEQALIKIGHRPASLDMFRLHRLQSLVYFRQGFLEQARGFVDGARSVLEAVGGRGEQDRDELDLAWSELYHLIALVDGAGGEHQSAVRYYDQEIEILERLDRRDRLGSVYNNISGLLKTMNNLAGALKYQLGSYQIAQEQEDRLSLAISLNNLGEIYYSLGDFARAEKYYLQYLEVNKIIANRLGDAFGLAGLGRLARARGRMVEAEDYYQQALTAVQEVKSFSREASILAELCHCLCQQGRLAEAEQALEKSVALCLKIQNFNSQRNQYLSAMIKMARYRSDPSRGEDLLGQARELLVDALRSPVEVEDEEYYSANDLERSMRTLLAEIYHSQGKAAAPESQKAWQLVARSLEMVPESYHKSYLARPEIAEAAESYSRYGGTI